MGRLLDDISKVQSCEHELRPQTEMLEQRVSQRTAELQASLNEQAQLTERFALACRAAQLGVWDWNIQSNELIWDEQMFVLYGVKREEFGSAYDAWLSTVHPNDKSRADAAVQQCLREHEPFESSFRVIWTSGEVRAIKAQGRLILDADGKPLRLTGINYDITERTRQEMLQSLRREITEQVARRVDLGAILKQLIVTARQQHNRLAMKVVLGPDVMVRLGQAVCASLHNEFIEPATRATETAELASPAEILSIWSTGNAGVCWSVPIQSATKQRLGRFVAHFCSTSQPTEEEKELVAALADVAALAIEHTLYIRDLEAAREAALMSSRSKSEFLANMSHEIRTPMNSILGYAEILRDDCQTNSIAAEALETIQRNGQHLLEIIDDILDLSKIESGKLKVERLPCSPVEIVRDVMTLMQVRAAGKRLQLSMETIEPFPDVVHSDPLRLRQILINLVGNAIKFTDLGGINVSTRLIRTDRAAAWISIQVSDTGMGMTPAQLARLFQPFVQADSTTTRRFGGTGLGLTISRRLAKLLGGDISATSQLGEGSCFELVLPIASDEHFAPNLQSREKPIAVKATASHTSSDLPNLSCRILLVEDGPDNQRLINLILKKAGAEVAIVANGQEALDAILVPDGGSNRANVEIVQEFDAILMDIQMPVMDGYEATRCLRAAGYGKPIIALTAHAMDGEREKCLAAGCDAYHAKPIDRRALLSLLEQLTNRSSTSNNPMIPNTPPAMPSIVAQGSAVSN